MTVCFCNPLISDQIVLMSPNNTIIFYTIIIATRTQTLDVANKNGLVAGMFRHQ